MPRDEILTNRADPERFAELIAACDPAQRDADPLRGLFGRRYYPAVFGDDLADHSFAVVTQGDAALVVECDLLEGTLGRFGNPMRVFVLGEASGAIRRVLRCALNHLGDLARSTGAVVRISDHESAALLSPLGLACWVAGGRLRPAIHAVADLARSEAELLADVRRRYRSLINRGRRELSLQYCNRGNPDRELFAAYQRLHADVAGRVTRSQESWDVMFETIAGGLGELALATLDGKLAGGTMVVDGIATSCYASGAYRRDLFEHPLAHWPLMDCILRARGRGIRFFDIGEVFFAGDGSDKEESIAFFKKGFTSRIEVRPVWDVRFTEPTLTESAQEAARASPRAHGRRSREALERPAPSDAGR